MIAPVVGSPHARKAVHFGPGFASAEKSADAVKPYQANCVLFRLRPSQRETLRAGFCTSERSDDDGIVRLKEVFVLIRADGAPSQTLIRVWAVVRANCCGFAATTGDHEKFCMSYLVMEGDPTTPLPTSPGKRGPPETQFIYLSGDVR